MSAHKVEYSEPVNSFTNTTKTTDEYAWITPDLEVNINDSFEDWDFAGQNAVVNSVSVRYFFKNVQNHFL